MGDPSYWASTFREDGANLAPFLLELKQSQPSYYRRIVDTIRQVAPYFDDFFLEDEYGKVMLRWRERESDKLFGPHLASDGTLRMMALIALLMQPEDKMPALMILDEPELGLHPFAVNLLAELLKSASLQTQIIIATQSMNLVDYFEPENILVVERNKRASTFKKLDLNKLEEWLEEYSLAELWEKNVIGGRP